MKKILKIKFAMIGLAALLVATASLRPAQEPEQGQEQNLSDAALLEIAAVCGDLKAICERAQQANNEAIENHIAINEKELQELGERLRAEGKSEEEIKEAGAAFIQAFEQSGNALLEQQKISVRNRMKEIFVARAPTLLAEDPDLKKALKLL